jgi:RNA polymerase sigma factor (sigma-70 family)
MELWRTKAFSSGETWALERVYQEHVHLVQRSVRVGLYRAGWLSSWNLADIVQETFARAFSPGARQRYDGTRCYTPYLLAIARHCLVDWLRRVGRDVSSGQDPDSLFDTASDRDEESEFAPELVSAAHCYISGLSDELRAVHQQRFELNRSQARAAAELGISRQNLRTLERKLVTALRRRVRFLE